MEKDVYPFYRFFQRLRQEVGIELDLSQYLAFWELLLSSQFRVIDWEQVLDLCKILWLSKIDYQDSFERIFREEAILLCSTITGNKREGHLYNDEANSRGNSNTSNNTSRDRGSSTKDSDDFSYPHPESEQKESGLGERRGSIYLQFSEIDQGKEGTFTLSPDGELLDNNYLFSEKYSPLLDRRLQQHWKYLRSNLIKKPGTALDVGATVKELAQWGLISTPKYLDDREKQPKIIFLVDQSPSMVAFEYMEPHFMTAFRASLPKADIKVAYFHNSPKAIYNEKKLTINQLISKKSGHKVAVLIFSDAGAARGSMNTDRIDETRLFLDKIRQGSSTTLWFNPLPLDRWLYSSADYISYYVNMLEVNLESMKSLPGLLKRI